MIRDGSIVAFTKYRYEGEQRLAPRTIQKKRIGTVVREMNDSQFDAGHVYLVQIVWPDQANYRRALVRGENISLILDPEEGKTFAGKTIGEIVDSLSQIIIDLRGKR